MAYSYANYTHAEEEQASRRSGFSFYQRIFFLYLLNLADWICTEALLGTGKFFEANPLMNPVLESFWPTVLIKGVLPLGLVLVCALIYKLADIGESRGINILLNIGIAVYAAINLWHILNFVLLFSSF